VTVEEVPVAAIVVMIAGAEFDIVQTEGIPLIRRRRHLIRNKEMRLIVSRVVSLAK